MSYKTLERHISPDEVLTFLVLKDKDGDTLLGFENFDWHTHVDLLGSTSGLPEDKAIRQFVDKLLDNKQIIVLMKKGNKIDRVWITEDPIDELKYRQDDEVLEFRYWNGEDYVLKK